MADFIMLVGVAGSGKSTFAKSLIEKNDNTLWVSSDKIREELYGDRAMQGDNVEVFGEMLKRTNKALNIGVNVIYDATNINRKRRKGLLSQLPRDVSKRVFYINTPYKHIIHQNDNREYSVPIYIVDRMYKNLHIPIESEGWDSIDIVMHDSITDFPDQVKQAIRAGATYGRYDYDIMVRLSEFFTAFSDVLNLAQDSSYHSFSVSRHIYYVYDYVLKNYDDFYKNAELNDDSYCSKELFVWAALLHDVGKRFCKSFHNHKGEATKYANFIGHENVSAQMAVEVLASLGFSQEFILEATTLIQFHMYLLNNSNNTNKLIKYVGEDRYKILQFIRDADNSAH